MPDKDDKLANAGFGKPMFGPAQHYYTEMIRIVTGMLVGVLALMTFLLTVGFQRPHADFSYALYTTIIVLGLNLLAYAVAHIMFMNMLASKPIDAAVADEVKLESIEDKEDKDAPKKSTLSTSSAAKSKFERAKGRLRVMRVIQQVLFILAICAVTWLALAVAHFFFTLPTTTSSAGQ